MCYLSGADTLFVHCSINTQRDRDRHTDRQKVPTDNETYIWTRDSNRQRDKHTDKSFQQTERQTDGQMY